MSQPQHALGEDRVSRIARPGDHCKDHPERVNRGTATAQHEHQHAAPRERCGSCPAARERLAVEQQPGNARQRGRRPERHDRPNGDPGSVDGGEERELIDRDGRRDHPELPQRPRGRRRRDGARDEQEQQPADGDPHGPHGERLGVGSERLRRASLPKQTAARRTSRRGMR